jgi:hypothetical protein
MAAMLAARASDVSSLDEQRAALRKRGEAVAKEQQTLQQLIVGVAKAAQQGRQHRSAERKAAQHMLRGKRTVSG